MSAALKALLKSVRRRLLCKPTLVALWSLVIIVAFYKILEGSRPEPQQHHRQQQLLPQASLQVHRYDTRPLAAGAELPTPTLSPDTSKHRRRGLTSNSNSQPLHHRNGPATTNNKATGAQPSDAPASKPLSSTRKTQRQYRQGRAFILLMRNEFTRSLGPSQTHYPIDSVTLRAASSRNKRHNNAANNAPFNNFLPAHIQAVVETLEAHKIEYTIDTTRAGIPQALLDNQNLKQDYTYSKSNYFSVIIIDDLVRYTRLSRWTRDQLDRLCRVNRIGVVAFFNGDIDTGSSTSLLLDQMPLSVRPVQNSCTQDTGSVSQPTKECLVDYELNDKSPILRLIKGRPNFVIKGPLADNGPSKARWISMASNHKTFEPLTFAQVRPATPKLDANTDKSGSQFPSATSLSSASSFGGDERIEAASDDFFAAAADTVTVDSESIGGGDDNRLEFADSLGPAVKEEYDEQQRQKEYEAVVLSTLSSNELTLSAPNVSEKLIMSMVDNGSYDGIRRVIFGASAHFWLHRALLLDAIEHLSGGAILTPLDRFIQIDIDDIFVGETGTRMKPADVEAPVKTQRSFAALIDGGFQFNLGYSGKFFRRGSEAENKGDEELVRRAQEFAWFCHTWSHSKAHLANDTESIVNELAKNRQFALEHKLPLIGEPPEWRHNNVTKQLFATYAVAPHHSGVYPIHGQLFDAWKKELNVQVTSTEEYPALRPFYARKAFAYDGIKVLPRQTCGLYTHTVFRRKYPGGASHLDALIDGGELFQTLLHNPVNVYMTHMSNYANDRLASYTFARLIHFVQTNTNLQLRFEASANGSLGPLKLADYYLSLFPEQRAPLWTNPCLDKRHLAIWAPDKRKLCALVPQVLIVGPQKTGTTALLEFMQINPVFASARVDASSDFEEVQFFNDKHYLQGVDWYLNRFDSSLASQFGNSSAAANDKIVIDKSATYFDDGKAPLRARALLPDARILVTLTDPADRAYSWYQHARAHNDSAAVNHSFERVLSSANQPTEQSGAASGHQHQNSSLSSAGASLAALRALRARCLEPGHYAEHLARWLAVFPARQLIIVDGHWFKQQPASALNKLQQLLLARRPQAPPVDYNAHLAFDAGKRFYCQLVSVGKRLQHKCLGPGKGRRYVPMSGAARAYLARYYRAHNAALARVLYDQLGQPLPAWLDLALGAAAQSTSSLR